MLLEILFQFIDIFFSSPSLCIVIPNLHKHRSSSRTAARPPLCDQRSYPDLSQPPSLWDVVLRQADHWTRQKARHSPVIYRLWMITRLLADHHSDHRLHWQLTLRTLQPPTLSGARHLNSVQQHRAWLRTNNLSQHPVPPLSKHSQTCSSSSSILFPRSRQYQHRKQMARRQERVHLASASAGCTASKAWRTKWASCQHKAREAAAALQLRDVRAKASLVPTATQGTIFMFL